MKACNETQGCCFSGWWWLLYPAFFLHGARVAGSNNIKSYNVLCACVSTRQLGSETPLILACGIVVSCHFNFLLSIISHISFQCLSLHIVFSFFFHFSAFLYYNASSSFFSKFDQQAKGFCARRKLYNVYFYLLRCPVLFECRAAFRLL